MLIKFLKISFLLIVTIGLISAFSPRISNYIQIQVTDWENNKTLEQVKKETTKSNKNPELEVKTAETPIEIDDEKNIENSIKIEPNLPETAYLEVEFICQAPFETEANWKYHEESCEEAALLQVYNFETGKTTTKEESNQIILDMIDWQKNFFGSHKDLYAEEMKNFISNYYKIAENKIIIVQNAEIQDIKKIITAGHPIIVPLTSEYLNNPYYPHPGYHMLVAIGYTDEKIITNDNGTRRGKDFSYQNEDFMKAMKDSGGDILYLNL